MSSTFIRVCDNKRYIVEPFTIDSKNSKTLDDGFSITSDNNGCLSLNIHISLICAEFLLLNLDFNKLLFETRSIKIENYIEDNLYKEYSLQTGLRKVLTLQITRYNDNISHNALCEEIPIVHNYCYDDILNEDFNCLTRLIFNNFKYNNSHDLVASLMGYYSLVFSQYLYWNKINFIVNNPKNGKSRKSDVCKVGRFTSPLRKKDSFLNQFVFLRLFQQMIELSNNQELSLIKDNSLDIEGQTLILAKKPIDHHKKF